MTSEHVVRMAIEAGIIPWNRMQWSTDQFVTIDEGMDGDLACLMQFAALIAATEREACAKVCEAEGELRKDAAHKTHGNGSPAYGRQMSGVNAANNCAAAIRARKNT